MTERNSSISKDVVPLIFFFTLLISFAAVHRQRSLQSHCKMVPSLNFFASDRSVWTYSALWIYSLSPN